MDIWTRSLKNDAAPLYPNVGIPQARATMCNHVQPCATTYPASTCVGQVQIYSRINATKGNESNELNEYLVGKGHTHCGKPFQSLHNHFVHRNPTARCSGLASNSTHNLQPPNTENRRKQEMPWRAAPNDMAIGHWRPLTSPKIYGSFRITAVGQ